MQLSVRDVARAFGVTEDDVYNWIADGRLPDRAINGQQRFNRSELLEWATLHQLALPPDFFGDADGRESRLPTLTEALERGQIFHGLKDGDKTSALAAIVECIPLPPGVNRKSLLSILLAREALASTGIGDGIAIPHPRNPITLNQCPPQVSLGFLEHPVDFNAIDGRPVYALFIMVSPTPRVHLHLLSRLSYALHRDAFRRAVVDRAPAATILAESRRAEPATPTPNPPARRKEVPR